MAGAIVTDGITATTAEIGTLTTTAPAVMAGAAFSVMPTIPCATVAAAGANQGAAAAIATGFTLVSGADDAKGVKLPAAAAGLVCIVKNNAAADLLVYPGSSDAINAIAANSPFTMLDLTCCLFVAYDATTWYTVPLVAS